MSKKDLKVSLIINSIIFILVLLGIIFMMTGFRFMANTQALSLTGLELFRYYTVDSNALVGIASLLFVIYEILIINKKKKEIPKYVYLFKYIGTVAVALTFIVTMFYLAPTYGSNFLLLYQNSNLFFHLIVPILSFISYVFFEKINLDIKYTFYGISTMIIYGIFYVTNILIHQKNGIISLEYDWYGFVKGGTFSIFVVLTIMIIITYAISLTIYQLNKPKKN